MQSLDQFNGVWVADYQGRRIGRVVGAHRGDVLFTVDWLVVGVRWKGRRALPADSASATMTGLQVPLSRTEVLASPPVSTSLSATLVEQAAVEGYYAQSLSLVTH